MGDSDFSSLMELVDSHLSKTSLSNHSEDGRSSFPLASVSIQTGKSQTVFTPPNGIMSIPRLTTQDNEINEILAQQVTNMLIAKEKKKQEEEERLRLAEEQKLAKRRQNDDYVIDLMSSIILPNQTKSQLPEMLPTDVPATSLPLELEHSDISQIDCIAAQNMEMVLPLNQDMSYMLFRKVKRGRPSAFGKVIAARVRPVAAPYIKVDICNPKVKRFDFSTQSPCDINLEKRRHPPQDPYAHMNMVERFMAQTSNDVMQNM